ncbi:MAG: hypothetical protein KKD39_03810 [Candidatus Altiarchaeota archaeon]|nr:hypothetical protein [Candidatus Altiarchaeota archaeon]
MAEEEFLFFSGFLVSSLLYSGLFKDLKRKIIWVSIVVLIYVVTSNSDTYLYSYSELVWTLFEIGSIMCFLFLFLFHRRLNKIKVQVVVFYTIIYWYALLTMNDGGTKALLALMGVPITLFSIQYTFFYKSMKDSDKITTYVCYLFSSVAFTILIFPVDLNKYYLEYLIPDNFPIYEVGSISFIIIYKISTITALIAPLLGINNRFQKYFIEKVDDKKINKKEAIQLLTVLISLILIQIFQLFDLKTIIYSTLLIDAIFLGKE